VDHRGCRRDRWCGLDVAGPQGERGRGAQERQPVGELVPTVPRVHPGIGQSRKHHGVPVIGDETVESGDVALVPGGGEVTDDEACYFQRVGAEIGQILAGDGGV
jgi:hypothetical protein